MYIRPPWFNRPLLPPESERIQQEYIAAMQLGYNLRSSHNLQQTRVIIMDIGSAYYNNWEGDHSAASAKWFVDKYVIHFFSNNHKSETACADMQLVD